MQIQFTKGNPLKHENCAPKQTQSPYIDKGKADNELIFNPNSLISSGKCTRQTLYKDQTND